MNKKITEMHNQAIKYSFDNGGLRISSHIPNDYIEKLAELIIKECAQLATKEYESRGAIHGNDLLDHFGLLNNVGVNCEK